MRSEYLMIFVFLSIGVVGGTIYNLPRVQNRSIPEENAPELVTVPLKITSEIQSRFDRFVKEGDEYLLVGNSEDAISYYTAARQILKDNPAILFRLGIAHFSAERFPSARLYFRDSFPYWQRNDAKRIVNTLMLAKTSVAMGQTFEAIESLSTIYLSSEGSKAISDHLRSGIAYELLVSMQQQAARSYLYNNDQINLPDFDFCPLELKGLLDVIDENDVVNDTDTELVQRDQAELLVLQKPNQNINTIVVSGKLGSVPVNRLLDQLGEKIGIDIVVTPSVRPYITGQITRFNSEAIAVSVLLDILLYPLDLTWIQDDNQINIISVDNFDDRQMAELRGSQAIRLGRYMLLQSSNHECRDSVVLANANLLLLGEDYDGASAIYQQLLDAGVAGELKAKTHYNRGLIAQHFDRSDQAIEEFLAAVDQSLDPEVQASGYYHISQMHLQNNNIRPAIISGSRSLSLTGDLTIRGRAAMNLARAYLINRDPASANRLLFEEAEAIKQTPQSEIAGVFGAFARSLASLSPLAKKKAVETLVIALADIEPGSIDNSVDSLILAKAYQQVGLPNQAVKALQVDVPNEKEAWSRQRLFESALLLEQTNFRASGRVYEQLASDASDLLGKRAILRLAKQKLSIAKDPKSCIELCKTLWAHDPSENIKVRALDLMGLAYRQLGDIDSSIYCFYGMLPDDAQVAVQVGQSQ